MSGTLRTIAVAVAVALVTAGGATAAFVVTSKNIKNGTIQLVDISAKAKKALRGQRGPRGPQGIQEITEVQVPATMVRRDTLPERWRLVLMDSSQSRAALRPPYLR
jgi:hypothetical protein